MNIELASGRLIRLSRITQWRTNGGLLCGKPTPEMNDDNLLHTLDKAREFGKGLGEPVLIEPRRTPVPPIVGRDLPPAEWLPATTCIAMFDSNALQRDDSEPYSSLVIAWFQDEFALPIDDTVLHEIRQIDWERFATDWCW